MTEEKKEGCALPTKGGVALRGGARLKSVSIRRIVDRR